MDFMRHSDLSGKHATLSPSKYHWINYDEDKMAQLFYNMQAAARGDRLHKLAHDLIREGIRLPDTSQTLNLYVNDAIGYRMTPEQTLYFSDNCFGTADAISFRSNLLRIHDLKTGLNVSKIHQLEVYTAIFCLEYKYKPTDIDIELRIYQNDEVVVYDADPDVIFHIMDKIISFDKLITDLRREALV